MGVIRDINNSDNLSIYLSTVALFCGISCAILMIRFKGFKASFNLSSGKRTGTNHYELAPQTSVIGAYRTSREDCFVSNTYSDPYKKITPSMIKLPQTTNHSAGIKESKSTGDLSKVNSVPAEVRKSTPVVAVNTTQSKETKRELKEQKILDKQLAEQKKREKLATQDRDKQEKQQLAEQKKREKFAAQERNKQEKQQLAEQKKREKLAAQERDKQEKLRKEREKQDAQTQAKEKNNQRKKKNVAIQPQQQNSAPRPQQMNVAQQQPNTAAKPKQKNIAPQPQQKNTAITTELKTTAPRLQQKAVAPQPPQTQRTSQYTTNTLDSSISKSSGPPPYSDGSEFVPNKSDNTGNTSFGKPVDTTSSWDLVSQHRQQVTRSTATTGDMTRQTQLDLHYNASNVTSREDIDNSEA